MDFQIASMTGKSASTTSIPSKIILKNTTGVSLNERFTILTNLRKQISKLETRRSKSEQGDNLPPQNRVSNSYAAAFKLKQRALLTATNRVGGATRGNFQNWRPFRRFQRPLQQPGWNSNFRSPVSDRLGGPLRPFRGLRGGRGRGWFFRRGRFQRRFNFRVPFGRQFGFRGRWTPRGNRFFTRGRGAVGGGAPIEQWSPQRGIGRGRGMRFRGGFRGGRGGFRGGRGGSGVDQRPKVTREGLDAQMEEYMSRGRGALDAQLDTYMQQATASYPPLPDDPFN